MARTDIYLDTNGNLVLNPVTLRPSLTPTVLDYARQKVQIVLKWVKGEFFSDTSLGIDYFGQVFIKNPNLNIIEDEIKNNILNIDEIGEFTSFNLIFNSSQRLLNITFTAKLTDESILEFNGTI